MLGIFWKLNGGTLENKKTSKWEHSEKLWLLPKTNTTDYVKIISGNIHYTESGEECKNKCGNEEMYNGRNWCWKASGSWGYCNLGKHTITY